MHTRSRVLRHIEQAFDEDPRLALTALCELLDEDIPWIERTVIRNARAQGYDWGRIGRLLRRSRQAVHKRYSVLDGTYEPITFEALGYDDRLTADIKRADANKRRWTEFEEADTAGDVVAW